MKTYNIELTKEELIIIHNLLVHQELSFNDNEEKLSEYFMRFISKLK